MNFSKLFFSIAISITIAIFCLAEPQKTLAQATLCCPQGYGTGAMDCPLILHVDKDKQCCKRTGIAYYDIVDKIPCTDENASGKSQCEAKDGMWVEEEGFCVSKDHIPCDNDDNCPPEYNRRRRFLGLDCACFKEIFSSKGEALKIKVQECGGGEGVKTAVGCIPVNSKGFVGWLFKLGVAVGGGIAFLLMAWGTFLVITSTGEPEKLNQGKEIIISAASGLLFIIFAIFLLRLIGVDILKIPGFE